MFGTASPVALKRLVFNTRNVEIMKNISYLISTQVYYSLIDLLIYLFVAGKNDTDKSVAINVHSDVLDETR